MLMAALLSQGIVAMDEKQVSTETKGLLHDLNAYRKCRKTGCPPELLERLQNRGYAIAKGVGAVVVIAGAAYGAKKLHSRYQERQPWQGPWGTVYTNLVNKFKFNTEIRENRTLVRNAFNGNSNAIAYVKSADTEAVQAAIFIAKQKGHTKLAIDIKNEYRRVVKSTIIF